MTGGPALAVSHVAAELYRIESSPNLEALTPRAQVTYECLGPKTLAMFGDGSLGYVEKVRWFIYRDRSAEGREDQFLHGMKPSGSDDPFGWTKSFCWDVDPGNYLVVCEVSRASGPRVVCARRQHVMSPDETDSAVVAMVAQARGRTFVHPDEADGLIEAHVKLLKAIAAEGPPLSASQRKEHEAALERWERHRKKLAECLARTAAKCRVPILAVHLDYATQQRRQLNFFLVRMSAGLDGGASEEWYLVDWTNPEHRSETSQSKGVGPTAREAIEDAFEDWDWWRGRYPPGRVVFEVPAYAFGGTHAIHLELETDGATTWDKIIGALHTASFAAGLVVIGVATLGAAIPVEVASAAVVSRVAQVAMAVSSTTGIGAEVVNYGQRRREGIHDSREDAISAVSILANLFQLKWARGATVTLRAKPEKYVFVGTLRQGVATALEAGVNLAQGVLILDESFREYDSIRQNPNLLPEERAQQLRDLFVRLAANGAMTYLSLKPGTVELRDVAEPRQSAGRFHDGNALELKELANPERELCLLDARATAVTGQTAPGKPKTVVKTIVKAREPAPSPSSEPSSPLERFKNEGEWRRQTIDEDYIWLAEKRENFEHNYSKDWTFEAKLENGTVTITVKLADTAEDGSRVRSRNMKAQDCYALMFEKFGGRIRRWEGYFAWENYAAVKKALSANKSPEEAALHAITAQKYWIPWAKEHNLKPEVVRAIDHPNQGTGEFEFLVNFVSEHD